METVRKGIGWACAALAAMWVIVFAFGLQPRMLALAFFGSWGLWFLELVAAARLAEAKRRPMPEPTVGPLLLSWAVVGLVVWWVS